MRNLFPNIESAIIWIAIICAGLWGANQCRKKTTESTIRNVPTESSMISSSIRDSVILTPSVSPAAIKPRTKPIVPVPTSIPSNIPDNYGVITLPNNTVPTVTQLPQQQGIATPQPIRIVPKNQTNVNSKGVPDSYNTAPSSGTVLYVLIDGMHIRTQANLKSKSLGRLRNNDYVYFMNEVTETPECVHLINGKEVCKPWFKVKTKRGTVGWVHGSGVDFYKRKATDNL